MATKKTGFRQADFMIALSLMMILAVLIIPVPTGFLDLLLVLSIGMSILVLVLTTQLRDPLQLSSFPSLLLMLTLFRLSLNVATTRQILLSAFAGNVVQSFGGFVVGGNYIVGIVVFLILITINFMVITKGSGRIAEVAARFTLDAMPGKQMSVDADLNAGLIDERQALSRREKLSREAEFYGAMDGASKFVRGDAMAGLIITVINICGGFAVGMIQRNMAAGNALRTYTVLTVGDGLVSQIPALVLSTAAGMMVTRAASDQTLGSEVSRQLFFKSRPLLTTGCILSAIAFVPGLPFLPFMTLGAAIVGMGFAAQKRVNVEEDSEDGGETNELTSGSSGKVKGLHQAEKKQISGVSPMDLEIGFGLVTLVDKKQGGKLIERIGMVRDQLSDELGFLLPPVNVRDNMRLKNTEYCIKARGLELARGSVRPGSLLAINPGTQAKLDDFTPVREPAFGFEAWWVPENRRELAESKGMTVVDCASVITTHLAEESKKHAPQILSRQDVSEMVEHLKASHSSVVQELLPDKMTIGGVHRVLQGLLKERVPIKDMALILETLADNAEKTRDTSLLVEFCRRALGGHICSSHLTAEGKLASLGIHPDFEMSVKTATRKNESDGIGTLAMDPALARELLNNVKAAIEGAREKGVEPVILCSPIVRPQLRMLTEHQFAGVAVISLAEVPDRLGIDMVGMVQAPKQLGEADERIGQAA